MADLTEQRLSAIEATRHGPLYPASQPLSELPILLEPDH